MSDSDKKEDAVPVPVEEEPEPEQRGLLAPLLDPVGSGLGTVLSPLGKGVSTVLTPVSSGVGNITKPVLGPIAGQKEEKMEVLGGNNKDSYKHGKDSLGGKLQTGENPLGLDDTGKWGFEKE